MSSKRLKRLRERIAKMRQEGKPIPLKWQKRLIWVERYDPKQIAPFAKPQGRKSFYQTREWKQVRYQVLVHFGARCQCCGATPADGVKVNVDHIEPISKAWHRRLDPANLQVLCGGCNMGKGASDQTDWRSAFDIDATDRI